MLHDDGRIVFLDFGLMSEVTVDVMEGFARGIQGLLSDDFKALTESMVDVQFVCTPIRHRTGVDDVWRIDPNYGINELAIELEEAMLSTEGGVSQFGALATVLNKKISPKWLVNGVVWNIHHFLQFISLIHYTSLSLLPRLVFTPPYVILLTRTFLTLEGIAQTVDPDFNIYDMAMPWAVKRCLSPSTEKSIDVFRSTILTEDNKIQWDRFMSLAPKEAQVIDNFEASKKNQHKEENVERKLAQNAAMKDAVGSLLGSSEGKTLRRVLKDIDSVDLVSKLSSHDARPILKKSVGQLFNKNSSRSKNIFTASTSKETGSLTNKATTTKQQNIHRPVSQECTDMRIRQSRWNEKMKWHLFSHHAKQCLMNLKGLRATTKFVLVFAKVFFSTMLKKISPGKQFSSVTAN